MSIDIYYFSGTGNSYVVARDIAKKVDGELISIASVSDKESINTSSEVIGIIFPRYYGSNDIEIPLIVRSFMNKLEKIGTKYIFVVCTYGGGVGRTFKKVDELIKSRGGILSAGYAVHMPQNAFNKPWVNNSNLYKKWSQKSETICDNIKSKRVVPFEKDHPSFQLLVVILKSFIDFKRLEKQSVAKCADLSMDLPFEQLMAYSDNGYRVDGNCNGCSICSKVCPVNNITIMDDKPVWQHHCENCLACYNWCPKSAIHGGIAENFHYHHPDVKAKDLMRNKDSIMNNVGR